MRLLGVSGSLRRESTNSILLEAAAQLVPAEAELQLTGLIAELPLFSPDYDAETIKPVIEWTRLMREADGLVVSTPEYARGYPGALKNAFDWLVQGDGFVAKPFMYLHASNRSGPSHQSLTVVLETMSGVHVAEADTTVPLLGKQMSSADIVAQPDYSNSIATALKAFAAHISNTQATV